MHWTASARGSAGESILRVHTQWVCWQGAHLRVARSAIATQCVVTQDRDRVRCAAVHHRRGRWGRNPRPGHVVGRCAGSVVTYHPRAAREGVRSGSMDSAGSGRWILLDQRAARGGGIPVWVGRGVEVLAGSRLPVVREADSILNPKTGSVSSRLRRQRVGRVCAEGKGATTHGARAGSGPVGRITWLHGSGTPGYTANPPGGAKPPVRLEQSGLEDKLGRLAPPVEKKSPRSGGCVTPGVTIPLPPPDLGALHPRAPPAVRRHTPLYGTRKTQTRSTRRSHGVGGGGWREVGSGSGCGCSCRPGWWGVPARAGVGGAGGLPAVDGLDACTRPSRAWLVALGWLGVACLPASLGHANVPALRPLWAGQRARALDRWSDVRAGVLASASGGLGAGEQGGLPLGVGRCKVGGPGAPRVQCRGGVVGLRPQDRRLPTGVGQGRQVCGWGGVGRSPLPA